MSIDLSLTENEEMLKNTALRFLEREVPKELMQELHDSDTGYTEDIWRKVKEMGWLGIIIPEEYGGVEYPLTSAGVLFEALGTGPLPGPYFSSGILGSLIVNEAGTEEQKKEILPQVADGTMVLTLALTEPEFSWEPGSIKTSAEKNNGDFVLNGVKLFTFDALAATHFLVAARTGEGKDSDRGISLFLVDSKTAGVSTRILPGYLAGRTFEVKFESMRIPQSALLGHINEAWPALTEAINKAAPILCAYKAGGCQAVFRIAVEYSRVRVQFSQPIGRFQRVQDMIIEMINHADSARWTTYEALWKLDTDRPAVESVHLAKAVTSEAYWQVCTLGHRAISGISYSMEHPLALHTRTSRHLYNYLGEPGHHRQKIAQFLMA